MEYSADQWGHALLVVVYTHLAGYGRERGAGSMIILFPVLPGLNQFSPGGVHVDRRLDLLANGLAHQG